MPEDGEQHQPEQKISEERQHLRDLIFDIPCTKIERRWLSYFYDRDENLKQELLAVADNLSQGAVFVENLRLHIDRFLFEHVIDRDFTLTAGRIGLSLSEGNFVVLNWSRCRDWLMEFFLETEHDRAEKAGSSFDKLERSIYVRLGQKKKQGSVRSQLTFYREQACLRKIANSEADIFKILALYKTDLVRLKRAQLAGSPWVVRQIQRIVDEKNGTIQLALMKTFNEELLRYYQNSLLYDKPPAGSSS